MEFGFTAIKRRGLSKPMSDLNTYHKGIIPSRGKVFDYGCGHQVDAKIMRQWGLEVTAWDPYIGNSDPKPEIYEKFRLVTSVYVLCMIPHEKQRFEILIDMWGYVDRGGDLFVATRSTEELERSRQLAKTEWEKYNDGWITSKHRNTFQRGYTDQELIDIARGLVNVAYIESVTTGQQKNYSSIVISKRR